MNNFKVRNKQLSLSEKYGKAFSVTQKLIAILIENVRMKRIALALVLMLAFAVNSWGQTNGDYQTRGTGGNWNSNGSWQVFNGGWTNCAVGDYPGATAGAGTVTILNGDNVTMNVSPVNSIGALVIANGNNATTLTVGTYILNVTGAVTIGAGTGNGDNKIIAVGAGALSCSSMTITATGNNNRNSGITLSTGTVTVTGNITMGDTRDVVTFTGAGILNIGGTMSGGTFTPSTGTVNYNNAGVQTAGTYTYNNLTLSGSGAKTTASVTVNGILSMEGTATASVVPTYGGTASLQYKGSALQTTGVEFPATFSGTGGVIINNSNGVNLNISAAITNGLTLTSGTFAVGANTLTLNGPPIGGIPSNLSTTSSSSLVFGGAAGGVNIPSSVTNLNNLTINNSNGVTMNSNIAIAGTLTLSSGALNTSGNTINITSTSPAAISAIIGNYVEGSLSRAMVNAGGTYIFPVGASACGSHWLTFSSVSGTTPTMKVTFSCTGATTADNITITQPPLAINWHVETVSGTFTDATVELDGSEILFSHIMSHATAQTGTYSKVLSTPALGSVTATSIGSIATDTWLGIGTSLIKTYYSYMNGLWSTPTTWTSDPSGTTQVGSTIPGNGDIVEILRGRTVSLTGNVATTDLSVTINTNGFLDLSTYGFTAGLSSLAGQGTLIISSAPAVFPTPITTNTFINSGGGTVEYRTTSNLPAQATYNNLTINKSSSTVTQTIPTLTLNGNLHVNAGTFQINDATAQRLKLTVNGNVTVDAGAFLTVGTGVTNTTTTPTGITGGTPPFINYYDAQSHRIVLMGDFTNNGTVRFTNITYPVYNAFPTTVVGATSGFATVYFQGTSDNTLLCNGVTDFYNLVVDKGTDQTYKLTLYTSASSYSNFRLLGANTAGFDIVNATATNPNLKKALWVRTGTLVLEGTTVIPSLSEGANGDGSTLFTIPANGALELNAVDVAVFTTADDYREVNAAYGTSAANNGVLGITQGVGNGFCLFGKLEVNNGYFSTKESEGITTTNVASGQFILNKGTVDAKQFLSTTGSASYDQYGGTMILRGRFQRTPSAYTSVSNLINAPLNTVRANDACLDAYTATVYGTFSMFNTTNVFTMGGGTMQIYDVCGTTAPTYAFQVNSSSSNMNVTGGTVQFIPTAGTGGSADVGTHSITSTAPFGNVVINGTASTVQLSTAITVNGGLTLTSGTFNANSLDVTVGGNFSIANGTTYTTGVNSTIFNGSDNQTFTVNLGSALSLNNLTINKASGIAVNMAGSQTAINVLGNFNLTLGTLNDNGDIINVAKNTYNSGLHTGSGKISLNGTVAQTIDGNGAFQNLELNNSNAAAAPVSLVANTTVSGVLDLLSNKIFNIGTNNLVIGASGSITASGSGFSNSCFIQTASNSGDGGVTKTFSSNTAFVFPVGCFSTKRPATNAYTPATIGFSVSPTTYGNITVVPVGYEHPSTSVNGQSLTFFWRVKSSGFTGIAANSVTHSFLYSPTDINGVIGNYIPSLYNRSNYTWNNGLHADINTGTYTISDWSSPTNSTNFLDADYTAGDNTTGGGAFVNPVQFYSVAGTAGTPAAWNSSATWSHTSGGTAIGGASVVGVSYPGANNIAVIENNHYLRLTANASCASLQIQTGSTLDIYTFTGGNFGMVLNNSSGNGLFRVTTPVAPSNTIPQFFTFPTGDFSDYNNSGGTTEFYDIDGTTGSLYILPANVSTYGNLILTARGGDNLVLPNRSDLNILGDLTCTGNATTAWIAMSWNTNIWPYFTNDYNPTIEKTVHVTGNLNVNAGSFEFFNDATPQHLIVDGNITIVPGAIMEVYAAYPFTTPVVTNTLSIAGSLINNGTATFLSASGGRNYICNLTFSGNNNASITNTSGTPTTVFNNVTVNKGSSQATTLTCNIGGTLSTPVDNWLTLQNGTFQYTRTSPAAGANFTISTVTPFTIPSTAGLLVNMPANANNINILIANNASNTNDVYLAGKLTVTNGSVYVGPVAASGNNNDIEYASAGSPTIEVNGGTLVVNGQIRRNPSITSGSLIYTQTGGAVTINGNAANATNAKLEVLNSGTFNMSSGTLMLLRGGGGSTYGDLYLRPATSSVTGGTITLTNVVPNTAQTYLFDANVPLNNLIVTGAAGAGINATMKLMVNPLVLNGDLTLTNARSILDANTLNNINVTLNGNFTNSGTYNYYKNLTTFNGGAQSLLGTSATNFYDLNVNPVTSLTINNGNDVTVDNNLTLSHGTLICSTHYVNLKGNLVNDATYTDNVVSGGIVLNGTVQQQISGTGTFGLLNLNNTNGAVILNNITLNENLILTNGILDINHFLLTLGANSIITASGSPFSTSKMITSDGVWSDVGIVKVFNTAPPASFTYPLGVLGKYTPTVLSITSNASTGSVRVNNINKHHPAVLDATNVLNYYWEVGTSGITGLIGNFVFSYLASDVVGGPETSYYTAKLITPGTNWFKSSGGVDAVNHDLTFNYPTPANDASLTGEYTAGLDAAIPNTVPQYTSNADGNWDNTTIWTPSGGTTYPCPAGGPNGFIVTINNVVTANDNYCTTYKTYINGELKIVAPFFGHNLGTVYGSGTLYLESPIFPAGRFDSFLDCSGNGTIEYGGTGTYNIIADLYSRVPNLTFSGTGSRILPDKDLTICNQLLINGPTLDNSAYNLKLFIKGSMIRSSGAFISGVGDSAIVSFTGTTAQTVSGFTTANNASFNNFEINNSSGLTLTGSVDVGNKLMLTNGLISTSAANSLRITNYSTSCVIPDGGSSTSYVDGPLIKKLNQGDPIFKFPVGKKGIGLGNKLSIRATEVGTMYWTVEYFNPNTFPTYQSPLTAINTKEFWTVNCTTPGSQAFIDVAWDPLSDLTPLMTLNGVSDMRVAEHNGTDWVEIASTGTGDNYNGSVETSALTTLTTGTRNYTLSCINAVKPKVRLAPAGPICGTAGIPVTLTSTITPVAPITVNYTENGVAKNISPASFPTTIPTIAAGATYVLTSFTYNYPSGTPQTGVVDVTPVTTYGVPTAANAGPDQSICGGVSATLAGNLPVVGTGLWSIVSGTGGTVVTPTSRTSVFNGTNGSGYTLRWTISNGTCTSSDDVIITFPLLAAQPSNFTVAPTPVCQQTIDTYTVPNDPTVTNYTWTYSGSGVSFSSITNSVDVTFSNIATSGDLSVTATNSCNTSIPRTVTVTVNPLPVATMALGPTTSANICDGANTELVITSSVGTSPYEFVVSVGAISETLSNKTSPYTYVPLVKPVYLVSGSPSTSYVYSFTIQDANGCINNGSNTVTVTVWKIPETGPPYHIPSNFGL